MAPGFRLRQSDRLVTNMVHLLPTSSTRSLRWIGGLGLSVTQPTPFTCWGRQLVPSMCRPTSSHYPMHLLADAHKLIDQHCRHAGVLAACVSGAGGVRTYAFAVLVLILLHLVLMCCSLRYDMPWHAATQASDSVLHGTRIRTVESSGQGLPTCYSSYAVCIPWLLVSILL
jgi:hypothetical protein